MFSILRASRPIRLSMVTSNAAAHRMFKPDMASKYMPDWAADSDPNSKNVKSCYAFKQMFSRGFVVPMWADIDFISSSENGEQKMSVNSFDATLKTDMLRSPFMQRHGHMLLKINSPWLVECAEDVSFTVAENIWTNPSRAAHFMSGCAAFKYQHGTNMFAYIPTADGTYSIQAGDTPLVWIPQSDRRLEISAEYDPEKFKYLEGIGSAFLRHRYARAKQAAERAGK